MRWSRVDCFIMSLFSNYASGITCSHYTYSGKRPTKCLMRRNVVVGYTRAPYSLADYRFVYYHQSFPDDCICVLIQTSYQLSYDSRIVLDFTGNTDRKHFVELQQFDTIKIWVYTRLLRTLQVKYMFWYVGELQFTTKLE